MKRRYLAAGLLLAAFAVPVRADEAPAKPITVPFELLKTGHLTVMVKVNGKGPYRLIFDTGAPITLLNNKIAKEAGLLKNIKKPLFSPFGSMGEVKIKELEVGDQKADDLPAVVMDHPTVEDFSRAMGNPIDGIVGFSFFARFKMTIDYQAKTLTFVPNGFKPPDAMKAMEALLTNMMLGGDEGPKIVAPAAQWGMVVAKESGDDEAGVTIKEVFAGSAAAAAGLKAGDRLLTIDSRWTDSVADLFAAAGLIKPGATAPVVVKRDGKEITLKVKPTAGL
jgi:hypothetical protein